MNMKRSSVTWLFNRLMSGECRYSKLSKRTVSIRLETVAIRTTNMFKLEGIIVLTSSF